MDELIINTKFTKFLICKFIKSKIKKSLGFEVDLNLENLNLVCNGEQVKIELSAGAVIQTSDLMHLMDEML